MMDLTIGFIAGITTVLLLTFLVSFVGGYTERSVCTDLTGGECVRKWVPAE